MSAPATVVTNANAPRTAASVLSVESSSVVGESS